MNIKDHAFSVNRLFLLVFLSSVICGSGAVLKTMYMEEMCYATSSATLNLRFHKSVILASFPTGPLDCIMQLKPEFDNSVVVAIYRYSIKEGDTLQFRDKHNFQLSVTGDGVFTDESKALFFDGPLSIHYATNNSYIWNGLKFQMVITQVHDAPCNRDEFKCRNNKCIPMDLACDKHNHCGDMSDEANCSPRNSQKEEGIKEVKEVKVQGGAIIIIVSGVALGIVIIVVTTIAIRICILRSKKPQKPEPPAQSAASQQPPPPSVVGPIRQSFQASRHHIAPPLQSVPVNDVAASDLQQAAPPSVSGRISQSLRTSSQPTAPPLETVYTYQHRQQNFEVPSMYPHLPSVPDISGFDNPEFKMEE